VLATFSFAQRNDPEEAGPRRVRFGNNRQHDEFQPDQSSEEDSMHGLIYLVGLIVVILAILSFFGLR
jgi:hypothetical protein